MELLALITDLYLHKLLLGIILYVLLFDFTVDLLVFAVMDYTSVYFNLTIRCAFVIRCGPSTTALETDAITD